MLLFIFFTTNLWLCFVPSTAELKRFEHPVKADGSLSFLMGVVGEKLDIDFVISTGDNFYEDGLTRVSAFNESFINIYTASILQKPWYNVLGNHDYRGDVEAQLSPILTKMDPRWLCLRSFIVNAGLVEFFFFTDPEEHTYDWKGILPRQEYLSNLFRGGLPMILARNLNQRPQPHLVHHLNLLTYWRTKDVDSALRDSTAKWKIVVGHHTIKSAGQHGITLELEEQLLPILQANNIDLYVKGPDHCLEHISGYQIQFLTSGGGSKAWRGDIREWNPEELRLYYDGQGFMSMQITQTLVDIVFYDVFGNVLHKWGISKDHEAAEL
ncbi:hypothetical protein ACB094_03G089600 [Castanea mollissima]